MIGCFVFLYFVFERLALDVLVFAPAIGGAAEMRSAVLPGWLHMKLVPVFNLENA